jgi:hypothetical protein
MPLWDYIVIDFNDFPLTLGSGSQLWPLAWAWARAAAQRTPCRCGIMQRAQKRSQKDIYCEGPTCGLGQQVYEYPPRCGDCIYFWPRGLIIVCECARVTHAGKRSVSVDLSQAQWMTATAPGWLEKRTALTFSKCRPGDISISGMVKCEKQPIAYLQPLLICWYPQFISINFFMTH